MNGKKILPNSSQIFMMVSSKLLTYHLTLVLKCFKLNTGYATSWPGPWNVIKPPRFVFLNAAPRPRSLSISSFGVSSLIPVIKKISSLWEISIPILLSKFLSPFEVDLVSHSEIIKS